MNEKLTSRIGPYSVALVAVGVGIALPLVTKPFVGQSAPFVSFIPAVLLSAWYGGFGPGLLTSALLVLSTFTLNDILFVSTSTQGSRLWGAFMFALAALTVCLVIRAMRLAQAAALAAAQAARAAEARAQTERDRLDVILRDLPVGVVIATDNGKVERANPAAMEIYGAGIQAGDDLPSRRAFSTGAGVAVPENGPIERSLRHGETIVNRELDILRPDGSPGR